jgi:siroheme synthase
LIAAGLDPETPALCIEQGTMPQQRVVTGTLATLPALTAEANIQPPALTVIGAVVGLREQGINWFSGS